MPFLPQQAIDVFEEEKDSTSKLCDDGEGIRSLAEAKEVTADVPERSVMYDDNKKFGPLRWESFCGSMFRGDFWPRRLLALTEKEIAALTTTMRKI